MTATRWPQVVDALVDLMGATNGYRRPGVFSVQEADVLVLDGPEQELTGDTGQRVLIVGGTLDEDGDLHGNAGQSIATLSPNATRDDNGLVICQAIAMAGSAELESADLTAVERDTVRSLRSSAFSILDDVDTVIRASRTLGISAPRMFATLGDTIIPRQYQSTTGGAVVTVQFEVRYGTRV